MASCWTKFFVMLTSLTLCFSDGHVTYKNLNQLDQSDVGYEKSIKSNSVKSIDNGEDYRSRKRYYRHVDWRRILGAMLQTECSQDFVRIVFSFDTWHARLSGDLRRIFEKLTLLAENAEPTSRNLSVDAAAPGECLGFRDRQEGRSILNVRLCQGCCGAELFQPSMGHRAIGHRLTVALYLEDAAAAELDIDPFKEEYNISCTRPAMFNMDSMGKIDLKLYEDSRSENPLNFPKFVEADEQIFLKGEFVSQKDLSPVDLKAFPLNCWLTHSKEETVRRQKRFFLRHGCPAKDEKNRGLSTVHQFTNGLVMIGFRLVDFLLDSQLMTSSFAGNSDVENKTVLVQCEFMACVHSNLHAMASFPRCPLTTYCSAQSGRNSMKLPFNVQSNNIFTLKSGPLVVQKLAQSDERQAIPMNDVPQRRISINREECRCPKAAAPGSTKPGGSQPSAVVHISEGLSTAASIFIALASFLSGVATTAFICFYKVRTEKPRPKFYEMKEQVNAQNISSVGLITRSSSTNIDRSSSIPKSN